MEAGSANVGGVFGFPESKFLIPAAALQSSPAEPMDPTPTNKTATDEQKPVDAEKTSKPTSVQGNVNRRSAGNEGKETSSTEEIANLKNLITSRGDGSSLFATIFLDEPGSAAQAMGPEPEAAKRGIKAFDDAVGEIVKMLAELKLVDVTNLVIASTPGYAEVVLKDTFSISKYTTVPFSYTGQSPILSIRSNEPGLFQTVLLSCKNNRIVRRVYIEFSIRASEN